MAEWEQAAADQLNRLQEPHRDKKRATVIALVDARLAGHPEETVWRQPHTCARNTYHAKWKHDPVFCDVLDRVTQMATSWRDTRAVRALALAAENLALVSPAAVAQLAARLKSDDEGIVLRAAIAILDRAGLETAPKGTLDARFGPLDELSDDDLSRIATGTSATGIGATGGG